MKDEINAIKEGLKSLPSGLWDFFKKILVFLFFYGRLFVVIAAFSILIMLFLRALGVSLDICMIVLKITLIIGQIIPAASYIQVITEDPNIEGSPDICFSGWLILSVLIWYL
jgi:hypothetical protein